MHTDATGKRMRKRRGKSDCLLCDQLVDTAKDANVLVVGGIMHKKCVTQLIDVHRTEHRRSVGRRAPGDERPQSVKR